MICAMLGNLQPIEWLATKIGVRWGRIRYYLGGRSIQPYGGGGGGEQNKWGGWRGRRAGG